MQDSWLSILGSVASIGAAIWAYIEAKSASRHASDAEKFRDELIRRRSMVEVAQVHAETNSILKLVSRVGPTCTMANVRGFDVNYIAQSVQEYSRFLIEHGSHFGQPFQNSAQYLCKELNDSIESLAVASTFEETKGAGKKIYYLINAFLPQVKQLADDKRER